MENMVKSNKQEYKLMYKREIMKNYKHIIGSTNKTDYIPSYIEFPIAIVRYVGTIRFLIPIT